MNSKLLSRITGCALGAALLLCGSRSANAQTSNSVVTFSVDMSVQIANSTFTNGTDTVGVHGTFNGWSSFVSLAQVGSSSIYTNTLIDTAEANGTPTKFQFAINPSGAILYEQTADFNNRTARLPATSGGSLILPTPFFGDAGSALATNITFQVDMSEQIALGNFTPGTSGVEVRGNFNGWTAGASPLALDPTIVRTNQYGLVSSNVYVGTFSASASTNASEDYKFVIQPGSYEGVTSLNADSGGNRFFTLLNQTQVLAVVDYSDAPFAPTATNAVTFQVDMSAQVYGGAFNPATESVNVSGIFNGWNTTANQCTNNPNGANTNLYVAVITVTDGVGATEYYKFVANGVYENLANNRFFVQPNATSTVLPAVYFNNVPPGHQTTVTTPTEVTFTVDMANASEYANPSYTFDPSNDSVYLNGDFLGWPSWNVPALGAYEMINNPVGSSTYSFTVLIPAGNSLLLTYKSGMYNVANSATYNNLDDEAGFAQNHSRYVRTEGAYTLPTDTFGNQFQEPLLFGELSAGKASGGKVPVTWLGLPGVQLQTSASLSSPAWVTHPETDGAVWTNGTNSNNGFISVTNYPASGGTTFFRLIQPVQNH